ncbi:YceI family protein [Streptosporangium lutulentum]
MSTRTWENLQLPTAGTFTFDVAHTRIGFIAKHMMVSKVRGHFDEFSGTVTVAENPLESSAELTIKAASISTGSPDRDGHLRGDDFLSVDKFPEITFRSTRVAGHSGDEFVLVGDLTIRDVTKQVELTVEYGGAAPTRGARSSGASPHDRDRPRGVRPDLEPGAGDRRRPGQQEDQDRGRGRSQPRLILTISTGSFLAHEEEPSL